MICNYILTRRCLHILWLLLLTIIICLSLFDYAKFRKYGSTDMTMNQGADCENSELIHDSIVKQYYQKRKDWKTSNLGTIMFKDVDPKLFMRKSDKTFLVLVWKNWEKLLQRHVSNYDFRRRDQIFTSILNNCSVKNCKYSGNTEDFYAADAIVMSGGFIPKVSNRNLKQRWVFLSEESPMRATFLTTPYRQIKDLANIFNWTMTYRSDSDIPIPFGRTLPLPTANDVYMDDPESALSRLVPFWIEKQFSIKANILISNCGVKRRMDYLFELQKYMKIDIRGHCAEGGPSYESCPRDKNFDCRITKDFLFHLVFEGASCRQYLTEKSFHHAYSKGAIPVIMGPPLEDCEKLLPPNSFLHVSNYKSPAELAAHMLKISESYEEILHYHAWRTHFFVKNEHGYFGTKSALFCRVCEALNYNDGGIKTYDADEMELFFSKKITCDIDYV